METATELVLLLVVVMGVVVMGGGGTVQLELRARRRYLQLEREIQADIDRHLKMVEQRGEESLRVFMERVRNQREGK